MACVRDEDILSYRLLGNLFQLSLWCAAASARTNVSWMSGLGKKMQTFTYQSHKPQAPHLYSEGAQEAGAYLQFIIDYYDCLPEVSFCWSCASLLRCCGTIYLIWHKSLHGRLESMQGCCSAPGPLHHDNHVASISPHKCFHTVIA